MTLSDRPADQIIENDEKFDKWYEAFEFEMEQKASKQGSKIDKISVPQKATKTVGKK
jgi:hypothetical protein